MVIFTYYKGGEVIDKRSHAWFFGFSQKENFPYAIVVCLECGGTGYYDAITKELYIKDIDDTESMFLRLVYAITTTKKKEQTYNVGYSTTSLSNLNYKQEHKNYGLNRAIVSNLVCRILYTEPTTLSIVPTYRTYKKDFLGNGFDADNNIYFLEGQILKQMCFALGIQEEDFYFHLFVNPARFLERTMDKCKVENPDQLLAIFDRASKNYCNYNKFLYYNRLLDNNFLKAKKTLPNEKMDEDVIKERNELTYMINKKIQEIDSSVDEEDELEESQDLWRSQIDTLRRVIGCK